MDHKLDCSSKNLFDNENYLTPSKYQNNKVNKISNINDNLFFFFKKKINLSSVFDHKGSKKFLDSKEVALQLIILDENNISLDNENDKNKNDNHNLKNFRLNYQKIFIENNRPKSSNNLMGFSNKDNNNEFKEKKSNRNTKSKHKENNYSKNNENHLYQVNHIHKTLVEKEINTNKKFNKFFSSQELKMFEDKDIKKIRPIKKTPIELKIKKEKIKIFSDNFVESENSFDSSLFNIVSQMK